MFSFFLFFPLKDTKHEGNCKIMKKKKPTVCVNMIVCTNLQWVRACVSATHVRVSVWFFPLFS